MSEQEKYIEKMMDEILNNINWNSGYYDDETGIIDIIKQIIKDTKEACSKAMYDTIMQSEIPEKNKVIHSLKLAIGKAGAKE